MSSKVWFVLMVFMMMVMGCTGPQVTPTPVPTTTAIPTPTAGAAVLPTAITLPELEESQTIAYNGFTFRPVAGWGLSTEGNSVSMEAPDALETAGPGIFITGGTLEDFGIPSGAPVDSTEAVIQSYLSVFIPVEASFMTTPRRVAVSRVPGTDIDFVVPEETPPYRGRITVLQKGNQIFLMLGLTPPERWEEFKDLYEQVLRATTMVDIER